MVGVGDAKEDVPVKGTSLQPNAVARRDSMAAKVGCLATARMLGRLASADVLSRCRDAWTRPAPADGLSRLRDVMACPVSPDVLRCRLRSWTPPVTWYGFGGSPYQMGVPPPFPWLAPHLLQTV